MNALEYKTLILNADYSPFIIRGWRRAMILIFKNVADEVDFYNNVKVYDTKGRSYPVPSVIRLHKYIYTRHKKMMVSKKKIFTRDQYRCGYCSSICDLNDLTIDHIIPKSKFKLYNSYELNSWTNLITACLKCNGKKADRTPTEANMPLQYQPYAPDHLGLSLLTVKTIPDSWGIYLNSRKKRYASKNIKT